MGPKELVLWVTTDCNLRCRYCYAGAGAGGQPMEWPVAWRALEIMAGLSGAFTVQFAGGEPLLNLELITRVVDRAGAMKVRWLVQTNATLMDRETAAVLRALGIAVGVSLDGLPRINDQLRPYPDGSGSTAAVISGVESLRAVGMRAGMTCVLSADNAAGLPGLVELASYMGNIEGISLDVLRPVGMAAVNGMGLPKPSDAARAVARALERADELAEAGGARVRIREEERMSRLLRAGAERTHRCFFDARGMLLVTPEGEAYPCPSLAGFPAFRLGNVMDDRFNEGLDERMAGARRLIAPSARCTSCGRLRLCGGPCPAQAFAQGLLGRNHLVECAVKGACIDHAMRRERREHAAAYQV